MPIEFWYSSRKTVIEVTSSLLIAFVMLLLARAVIAEPLSFPEPYLLIIQSANGKSLSELRQIQAEFFSHVAGGKDKQLNLEKFHEIMNDRRKLAPKPRGMKDKTYPPEVMAKAAALFNEADEKLFHRLDINTDTRLTINEYQEIYLDDLKKSDIDGDEFITIEEVRAHLKQVLGPIAKDLKDLNDQLRALGLIPAPPSQPNGITPKWLGLHELEM